MMYRDKGLGESEFKKLFRIKKTVSGIHPTSDGSNSKYYTTIDQGFSNKRNNPLYQLLLEDRRIGRFSYFFYSIMLPFLLFWVMAAIAGVIGKIGTAGNSLAYLVLMFTGISMLIIVIQLTIKRCHDFNASGWISILIFIPFAIFFFWLMPGNYDTNNYGDTPQPASNPLKIGCLLLIATIVATLTYSGLSIIKS